MIDAHEMENGGMQIMDVDRVFDGGVAQYDRCLCRTPIASALAAAVSKATGKYVKFKSAVLQVPEKKLTVSLKLSE